MTVQEQKIQFNFRHIHRRGFGGIVGMEHGNSQPGRAGERAVIDAYPACDAF